MKVSNSNKTVGLVLKIVIALATALAGALGYSSFVVMITCSNPRYIHVRNHTYAVGCGRCAACRLKTADKLSKRIDVEHLSCDTAYFGTLTYDNKSLPIFKIDSCDGINYVNPVTDRVVKDLKGVSYFEFPDSDCNSYDSKMWDNIHSRVKLPYRYVPLIYIRDFQLF